MNCYGGKATGYLSLNFAGENLPYSTDARLKGANVAEFLNAFPEARGMMTGTPEGTAKPSGEVTHSPDPLAGIRGAGQISVRDGQLPICCGTTSRRQRFPRLKRRSGCFQGA
jgi:hypothetical protein